MKRTINECMLVGIEIILEKRFIHMNVVRSATMPLGFDKASIKT